MTARKRSRIAEVEATGNQLVRDFARLTARLANAEARLDRLEE